MAQVFNCGFDFTYDMFVEDANKYTATPIKGVHCRANADAREKFMRHLKNLVRDYKDDWMQEHDNHMYDRYDGWIGDGFASRVLMDGFFSDYYKDTYGQRPHLPVWFYITVLGLPADEDVARTFCARPVEDAVERAKAVRENF